MNNIGNTYWSKYTYLNNSIFLNVGYSYEFNNNIGDKQEKMIIRSLATTNIISFFRFRRIKRALNSCLKHTSL